jgi:hypothetical protein
MVGDICMDGSNPVAGRAAKAAGGRTGTTDSDSTVNNRGGAGGDASDIGGHREAQRHNRQTHGCRR